MKRYIRWGLLPLALILILVFLLFIALPYLNSYKENGSLIIPGLKEEVKVLRDEKGMAYIYAENLDDALMAQGFITAQDRLFQMELTKLYATGRISELVGEKGEPVDIRMRTIGFHRQGKKQAEILDAYNRRFFQKYLEGVNFYIKNCSKEHPLEFKLAGIQPTPWDASDSLAVLLLMSWNSAANLETEIIAQMLTEKIGLQKAREIFPLNINPDDPPPDSSLKTAIHSVGSAQVASDPWLLSYINDHHLQLGSNNWTTGSDFSPGGKPIVANDPHLDARILPGPWYPNALITPVVRAVGAGIPGIPGYIIGRNEHIAVGVTNAYGDAQDLYIETLDPKSPDRYLEGDLSLPFEIITEKLLLKDKNAPNGTKEKEIEIRRTRRGPVVSGVIPGLETKKVITLRWAPFETMTPSLGLDALMAARNSGDIRRAVAQTNSIMLNFVFADKEGNIGWIASGKLPIRSQGDGTLPYEVKSGKDNWIGWIPAEEMPQSHNPKRGWVGTCNHDTVGRDYPYYYSSHLSPSYRYRRLADLLDDPRKKTADDHWQFQRDTMNGMAKEIAPRMAKALRGHKDTQELAEILAKWDFHDDPNQAAPTIFQSVYREFALQIFKDELGEDLARLMLRNWYFWQERLQRMVLEGTSAWFDDISTKDRVEGADEIFYRAAVLAAQKTSALLGDDPRKWLWGKVHTLDFVSPLRREGWGKGLFGGGAHPFSGSGETLCRGVYDFSQPFAATTTASLRMVADLNDEDKVLAVLPGGISGRLFHRHYKDQIGAFLKGEKMYWWFSDKAIQEHQQTVIRLQPR